jgi:uncharacterized protein YbcI
MREPEARTAAQDPSPAALAGPMLAEIADAVVRTYKRHLGKGPTQARAFIDRDVLVCLLHGGFSQSEHTLRERGRDDQVEQRRLAIQKVLEEDLRLVVEAVTGRGVVSFMSGNDVVNELQAEVFVLAPEPLDTGSEGEALAAEAERAREQARTVREEHRALRAEQTQAREEMRRRRESG